MIRKSGEQRTESGPRQSVWRIVAEGLGLGVLTGLVGVGGGFLIVPALVLFARLSMRTAVVTSLMIVTLNSAAGFFKYQDVLEELDLSVDRETIGVFIEVGVLGSLAGGLIGSHMNQRLAARIFAGFLIVMGIIVIVKEAPALFANIA